MKAHIDAITLGVTDLHRARRFYEDGLGGTSVQEAEGFAAFSLPGISTNLALYAWDALAADAGADPHGAGFRATALSFIVEDADRVDALVGMARRAGGSLVRLARSQFWGGYSGYIADPDGHLWKVGANHRPSIFRNRRNPSLSATPPSPSETAVTLACRDINQSKAFYADGLGFAVDKSYAKFVSFKRDRTAAALSLYAWDALAEDVGVGPKGEGFRGIALSHVVSSSEHVDEILRTVSEAGGSAAEPVRAPWGGYAGYFTDPSGHLWKVAARE